MNVLRIRHMIIFQCALSGTSTMTAHNDNERKGKKNKLKQKKNASRSNVKKQMTWHLYKFNLWMTWYLGLEFIYLHAQCTGLLLLRFGVYISIKRGVNIGSTYPSLRSSCLFSLRSIRTARARKPQESCDTRWRYRIFQWTEQRCTRAQAFQIQLCMHTIHHANDH